MSTGSLSNMVMGAILGGRDAQHVVHAIRIGEAPPDLLLDAVRQVVSLDDPERLRGFCREVQKAMERAS